MFRTSFVLLGVAALVLLGADAAHAQSAWPDYPLPGGNQLDRGPGFYFSLLTLFGAWFLFMLWVKTAAWVSQDAREIGDGIGMPAAVWAPVMAFPFVIGFVLFLLLPVPFLGLVILLAAYAGPLAVYVLQRNGRVNEDQKVFTPAHIKSWFANFGKGKAAKKKKLGPQEGGPPVEIDALGPDASVNQANMIAARQSPAFVTVKELLADAMLKRSDRVMLDYTKDNVAVRYQIDGMWHNAEPRDRESADVMLAVMKKVAGLDINERRMRQQGRFNAKFQNVKYVCTLTSQGVQTGERVVLQIEGPREKLDTLTAIGMRQKMQEQLAPLLGAKHGFVLFSAMPEGGLSTLWLAALKSTDRYTRDFLCVEDRAKPTPYIENVMIETYDAAAGDTPDKFIPKLLLKQPEVIASPELPNGETVRLICQFVNNEHRMAVAAVHAKEAVEALLRVLLLKAPPADFAKAITCVVNVRLVRKLCDNCKQAYEPPAQLLQKLGIPAGRVQAFYREYQPPPPGEEPKRRRGEPEVCPKCNGIGYFGRTGIFELLVITDAMKKALLQQPKLEVLRQVARQGGHRTLQEEGIVLVAQGVTSITELQRVLKQ